MGEIKVLSLFNGISCGRLALERAGINVDRYVSYEIDQYANQIAKKNYPNDEYLGDVSDADFTQYKGFDLVIGGSPCTHWSIAKNGRETTSEGIGFELFSHFVRAVKESECKYFLYENNFSIHKNIKVAITEALGVEPIMINSSLVSAQSRKRMYWTNIPGVEQPEDKGILLKDIILDDVTPVALHNLYGGFKEKSVRVFEDKSPTIRTAAGCVPTPSFVKKNNKTLNDAMNFCFENFYATRRDARIYEGKSPTLRAERHGLEGIDVSKLFHTEKAIEYMNRHVADGRNHWDFAHHSDIKDDKSATVVANFFKGVPYNVFKDWDCIRKFHPIECERLQTLPDNWTEGISATQRYKCIGNGWTVDVIAHIFKNMVEFAKIAENCEIIEFPTKIDESENMAS